MNIGEEGAVDDVGEASFEDAKCFEAAVAVCSASRDHGSSLGVPVRLGERDSVEGGIELPVASTVESVSGSVR